MNTDDVAARGSILRLYGISKNFGGIRALKNTSLDIEPGRIIALVGENGAGKSTLINIVSGLYRPDTGEIRFKGENVTWTDPAQALRHGIAVVHQELTLFPNLTVCENIFVGNGRVISKAGRLNRTLMREESAALLKTLGLEISVDRPASELSLAEQQLVEVAKAMAWQPELLILDEATSALDTNQVTALFDAVWELKKRGVTILFVSHRMYEIMRLCDEALILKDGVVIARISEDEMRKTSEKQLVEGMVGRAVSSYYPDKSHLRSDKELLKVENLTSGVLKGVDMTVRAGEIIGLGGLRGHGQEEFLRTLFGMPTGRVKGRITLDGKSYEPTTPGRAVANGLAYVPPDRKTEGAALRLGVEINLASVIMRPLLQKRGGNLDARKTERVVSDIRGELSIGQRQWRQSVSSLSGGNQQKVVLGKWLKSGFKILLMDEPTRGIDVVTKREIYDFLRRLTDAGVAVIAVSTDALELLGISDRIYVFYEGAVHATLRGDSLTEAALTKAIMGV